LAGVVYALLCGPFGLLALTWLKCVLVTIALGMAGWTAKALGASWGMIALLFPVLVFVIQQRVIERPHMGPTALKLRYHLIRPILLI
jgi:hypothetical protein